jgi:hypothetical protein
MFDCPHCGKPAISWFTKSWLGPGRSVKCCECGKKLSVSYISIGAIIPMMIGGAMIGGGDSPLLALAFIAIGYTVFMMVPLAAR